VLPRSLIVLAAVAALGTFGAGVARATAPGPPTAVTATPGNAKATVRWHAPSSTGGSAITGYAVTGSPSGSCTTTGALTCVVTGLTNGTSYTFTVTASNPTVGSASAASNSVTPAGPPGVPTHVAATAGNAQAKVTWTAPASNGGSPITKYVVAASGSGGQTCTWTSGALSCTVTGLLNGTSYTFTVTASNAVTAGSASAASAAVTPTGPSLPPTGISAVAGDQQATVSCTAPASNGGAAITSYTATASPGGAHASATTCPVTVTGLTDGTAYTFTVTTTNSLGTSVASAASNSVTPVDTHPPSAPAGLIGKFAGSSLVVSWQGSTDNVGVARYELDLNGTAIASVTGSTQATTHAIEPHGTSVYTVRAFDAAGNQTSSTSSVTVRPTPEPKNAPRSAPQWAWRLLKWQLHGQHGARPKTPKPLPHWYAAWRNWRLHPFTVQ
jgi:hypothetical protein